MVGLILSSRLRTVLLVILSVACLQIQAQSEQEEDEYRDSLLSYLEQRLVDPADNDWSFVISDVRVEGLQRVSVNTFFSAIKLDVGDELTAFKLRYALHQLFAEGYFDDVRAYREGSALVFTVIERPVVGLIEVEGNKLIAEDALLEGLANAGLAVGELLQRSTAATIANELLRQYVTQGRYGATVDVDIDEPEPGTAGDARISIQINEGGVSGIARINITNNKAFSDEKLKEQLLLGERDGWSWLSNAHKYSREQLSGDLENLRNFYLQKGYLQFEIRSVEVSISPDKRDVFINIAVNEGSPYVVSDVRVAGEIPFGLDQMSALVRPHQSRRYHQDLVTNTETVLKEYLQSKGYHNAEVRAIPREPDDIEDARASLDLEEGEELVDLTFYITNASKRTYVRRILIEGNTRTLDSVVRREIVQLEGASSSSIALDRSRNRLERTGYFRNVQYEVQEVPGADDQIDVVFNLEEESSGTLQFSLSQSSIQTTGELRIDQRNFLGTGRDFSLNIQNSTFQRTFAFSVYEPYASKYGLSRQFSVQQQRLRYDTSNFGAGIRNSTSQVQLQYGLRTSDSSQVSFGIGLEDSNLTQGSGTFYIIEDFADATSDGGDLFLLQFTGRYSDTTLNRQIFPTRGHALSLDFELGVSGDIEYLVSTVNYRKYFPVGRNSSFGITLGGSTVNSLDSSIPPPYQKFRRVGGIQTVRGYDYGSLGIWSYGTGTGCTRAGTTGGIALSELNNPNSTILTGCSNSIGSPVIFYGSLEYHMPLSPSRTQSAIRGSFFLDFGDGFATSCDAEYHWLARCKELTDIFDISYSIGFAITWVSAVGPLNFVFAFVPDAEPWARTEDFYFTQGSTR